MHVCVCVHGCQLHGKGGGDNWVIKIFGGGGHQIFCPPTAKSGGTCPPCPPPNDVRVCVCVCVCVLIYILKTL